MAAYHYASFKATTIMSCSVLPLSSNSEFIWAIMAYINIHPVPCSNLGIILKSPDSASCIHHKHCMRIIIFIIGPYQPSAAAALWCIVWIRKITPIHHAIGSSVIVCSCNHCQLYIRISVLRACYNIREYAGFLKLFRWYPRFYRHLIYKASVIYFFNGRIPIMEMQHKSLLSRHSRWKDNFLSSLRNYEYTHSIFISFDSLWIILMGLKNGSTYSAFFITMIRKQSSVQYFCKMLIGFSHKEWTCNAISDSIAISWYGKSGLIIGYSGYCADSGSCLFPDLLFNAFQRSSSCGMEKEFIVIRFSFIHITATCGIYFFSHKFR